MPLIAREPELIEFELCPVGNHIAVCFSVVDLGDQITEYMGQKLTKRKVKISWELSQETMTTGDFAGQPFSISKSYTLSLADKADLFKDLNSWRGRPFTKEELEGFDLFAILGAACMVNVTHKKSSDGTKTYASVASVAPLPKGIPKPPLINPIRKFSLDDCTEKEVAELPAWLSKKINFSTPVQKAPAVDPAETFDDDIPF